MDDYKPIENSDPLSEDTLLERIVWQGSIWLVYSVFTAMFLASSVFFII